MASTAGDVELARTSVIWICGIPGKGSSAPGEPFELVLIRHEPGLLGSGFMFGKFDTSDGPVPSGAVGHGATSSYVTEKITLFAASESVTVSPPLLRLLAGPYPPKTG